MTFEVRRTSRFKKDYRTMVKRGAKMELLHDVIDTLCRTGTHSDLFLTQRRGDAETFSVSLLCHEGSGSFS